ncbi:hypothetical protein, partial [Pseudomonas syringae]|uniref:hypothetical protein n=1 Tax=Pseudomonas syringae TaxID=317 RepID=UPI0019D70044
RSYQASVLSISNWSCNYCGEIAHEGASAGATIVRRSASHAFLDAPRPLDDAERRELRSHAGA